jgi:hypothetical protein
MASNDAREHERKEGLRERERAAAERLARLADERRREEEARRPPSLSLPPPLVLSGHAASLTPY